MTSIILNCKISTSANKSLDTFQVRVQRSPVQRRVAGVVTVVDKCRALRCVCGGEFLEKGVENFWGGGC